MSGPANDLFGLPNQAACASCGAIFNGSRAAESAQACAWKHEIEARRERARKFARTGVSQLKKATS